VIAPGYCHTMARYNRWQNNNLLTAADTLDEKARDADRGAFFGSIRGTFSHLLWGDTIWMSRFDGWEPPKTGIPGSENFVMDWEQIKLERAKADARILRWAENLTEEDLAGDLIWFSGAMGREIIKPLALCITHFFNHQTHHRGQIHAMLTAAGARPGDTDLFFMPEDA
jgi:uncharacterized damage-inducible protein DinB